ncbi:hypothetical protein BDK51DRAFT_37499 [Blyttiomyces helicus]|uniref:Uncharacterized protein n=1 Tax=Blyttiomyces helicus TaxID=388810 RepID=A0A4P9WKQ9_9FUNG|nr:hypothetical protein BDK51DRAFT_37499 [Blyttiomyces helicus]|eukprot:RKO91760.1 hypothetical protein BDK51DRAFT_37499 [Blyttiomyces helicus]
MGWAKGRSFPPAENDSAGVPDDPNWAPRSHTNGASRNQPPTRHPPLYPPRSRVNIITNRITPLEHFFNRSDELLLPLVERVRDDAWLANEALFDAPADDALVDRTESLAAPMGVVRVLLSGRSNGVYPAQGDAKIEKRRGGGGEAGAAEKAGGLALRTRVAMSQEDDAVGVVHWALRNPWRRRGPADDDVEAQHAQPIDAGARLGGEKFRELRPRLLGSGGDVLTCREVEGYLHFVGARRALNRNGAHGG